MRSKRKHPLEVPTAIRLSRALVSDLDRWASELSNATGTPTTRADVIRMALTLQVRSHFTQ